MSEQTQEDILTKMSEKLDKNQMLKLLMHMENKMWDLKRRAQADGKVYDFIITDYATMYEKEMEYLRAGKSLFLGW